MNNINSNNLVQYFGNNTLQCLKFIRSLVKNINNSRNLASTVDKKEKSFGFSIGLDSFTGLFNNPNELVINSQKTYYIRYFLNMYNSITNQLYGNTYRSPLLPVKINENDSIELINKTTIFVYVLSKEPKNDKIVAQIILVESSQDEVILKEKCLGWTLLNLIEKNENPEQQKNIVLKNIPIYRGTPRELIFNRSPSSYGPSAVMNYYSFQYKPLENIKFLLPNYIILDYKEPLPGLSLRSLPQIPNINENLKTVDFFITYIKNIEIFITPNLEDSIIQFGKEYKYNKYAVKDDQTNKVFIKERKIKCGIHNTWKFINLNGLQNSITLRKRVQNKLESNGVLMVENFFADRLSGCALILELEYILTVPINGSQREENLSLIIGYHIFVPERINVDYREKLSMFTGPGMTIYGEKMWSPQNFNDKDIKISYLLSQNNLLKFTESEIPPVQQNVDKVNEIPNTIFNPNNQVELNGMDKSQEQLQKLEFERKINYLENQLKLEKEKAETEKERERLKNKQMELENENIRKKLIQPKKIIEKPPEKKMTEEDAIEFQQFIEFKKRKDTFQKQLEEQELKLKELQHPTVEEYEPATKNISSRDKSTLIQKGVLDLAIKEPVDSYIDFALEKELCEHGLATIFNFQFLSFKPSKIYYRDLRNVPELIQFSFDFFNEKKLTPICRIIRPEGVEINNYYQFNNPLVLKRYNVNISSTLLNDSKEEILIDYRFDPSLDNSIDFRDFVKYLIARRLLVKIKDIEKCFDVGYIKIPLRDLVAQGKDKIQLTKEYTIYDDNFVPRGIIQLLITASKINTIRPYTYNRNLFKNINSREGYNALGKKKKIKVDQIDISKLKTQNINLQNYTRTNFNNPNINNNADNTDNLNDPNLMSEMNKSHPRLLRIDKELEKKLRVMKYFSNKTNMSNQNKFPMNNTNYSNFPMSGKIETRLKEIRQKQSNEQQYLDTLYACEQIREQKRAEILSKVSLESHKNIYNISLILGQPVYFNYSIFNESESEEYYHITIEKIANRNNTLSERYTNQNEQIVSVITNPKEWATLVEKEKLLKPNSYNVFSDDLYMAIRPGEIIPMVIKLLSYTENKEEEKYSLSISKKNGQPLYFLNINIKRVFPIYDHIFHYHFPIDNNKYQKAILVNPFQKSFTKSNEIVQNMVISDNSYRIYLDNDTHNFIFDSLQESYKYKKEFIIFIYSPDNPTKLYLTWKVELMWEEVLEIEGTLGQKVESSLIIRYDKEIAKENGNSGNNMTVQLFTNQPETIIFPIGYDMPFTIFPGKQALTKFILYPKSKVGNLALINCVNSTTRELYKSWLIKYGVQNPEIDETEKIICKVGNQTVINYNFKNYAGKPTVFNIYSSNEDIMEVIDNIIFAEVKEEKQIKLLIHESGSIGTEEVLLFISDNEAYNKTLLFIIAFE